MEYKSFFKYLKEGVEKYLIWEPTGIYRNIIDNIDRIKPQPNEIYRAASNQEVILLKRDKSFSSMGMGNTRKNAGTYVTSDISLAGAFAVRYFRDGKGGNIIVLDKNKLSELTPRDPGNFTVSLIPLEAVKRIINLKDLVGSSTLKESFDDVDIVKKLKELGYEYKGSQEFPNTNYNFQKHPKDRKGIFKQVIVYPDDHLFYAAFKVEEKGDEDVDFQMLRQVKVPWKDAEKFLSFLQSENFTGR